MRVVIAGLGSIGRRHLTNLQEWHPDVQVTVWHQHRGPEEAPADSSHHAVYSLHDALAVEPAAAFVTGPAAFHVPTALEFARRRVHLFIEKPLAAGVDDVDELLDACSEAGLVLMVGYCFRFYRPLLALRNAVHDGRIGRLLSIRAEAGQYLPDWRPGTDYREGVSARRALGGGALLELSHELDYVRWIAGDVSAVTARLARVSDLDIDVEDMADLVLEFSDGAVGSVHVDLVQRAAHRGCRVVGTTGTLVWDRDSHSVRLYSADAREWMPVHPRDDNAFADMYREELADFLDAASGRATHRGATGVDGLRVLEVVDAARRSSTAGCTVSL
jgi:predicted dehydrogenase